MKNIKKIFLLTFILFTALILLPNFSNAATTYSVYDVTTLTDALNTAISGDTIKTLNTNTVANIFVGKNVSNNEIIDTKSFKKVKSMETNRL